MTEARTPPIVTLCGSTRFRENFDLANERYTRNGWIVLSVGSYGHLRETPYSVQEKVNLDVLHFRKIDLSDRIHVLNRGGYIGDSTRREIAYAHSRGVYVTYEVHIPEREWEPVPEPENE